uniref:HHH_6 domain-containing protein n=1 Tax=Anisakis simplex TaxID=6269 RepID=A0A0M3KHE6_ANISI
LNVRVKERDAEAGRKGRLGSIFKDTPSTAIKVLFNKEQTAHEVKDTIRRPLSGLFRRPGSRGAFANAPEKETKPEMSTGNVETIPTNHQKGNPGKIDKTAIFFKRLMNKNVANSPGMGVNRAAAIYQLDALNAKNAFLSKLDDIGRLRSQIQYYC